MEIKRLQDKLLLLYSAAIVVFSAVSYCTYQATDPYRCKALLANGFWLGPSDTSKWQPDGCMLHQYKTSEASQCLFDRRILFIGGTRTLHLFEAVASKFDADYRLPSSTQGGANVLTSVQNVRLQFVWDPFLAGSELNGTRASLANQDGPALTVIGVEPDSVVSDRMLSSWITGMDSLMSDFGQTASRQVDNVIFAPLWSFPDGGVLSSLGAVLESTLIGFASKYNINIAFALKEIINTQTPSTDSERITFNAGTALADVLLNFQCNIVLPKHYPNASTCCNVYSAPSWIQIVGLVFIILLIPAAILLHKRNSHGRMSDKFLQMMPAPKYQTPIFILGGVVALCYFCDRTNVLGKEHKFTSPSQFFISMAIIIVISSIFTRFTSDKDDLPFLNRDQTDEWKGWMQISILVYHYVGVSQTPWIYDYMRVMPTSYLFMTGFGHTCYYLTKADYSFKRTVATMLRLNLLNCLLAFVMGNDWLLYYFAPLVTWNYFIILAVLYPGKQYNKNRVFLFGKMTVVALLNMAFYRTPGVLEAVWSFVQLVFRMQGDLREWRFRVCLDQYSIFPGMIMAVFFLGWKDYNLPKSPRWLLIKTVATITSAAIMLAYAVFETSQPTKQAYNQKHTYVSWLPCCAFVIIRNSTPWLRRTHNKFFAWAGRGSLETFLLQFHVWLAADTAGILAVPFIPANQRFLQFLVTTPMFFYVASLATAATGPVIEWIMGAAPVRPTLPTAYKSHPGGVPFSKTSNDGTVAPIVALEEKEGAALSNGVALNGHALNLKVQDPENLNNFDTNRMDVSKAMKVAGGDLRVRMALILLGMAVMNWTYYW